MKKIYLFVLGSILFFNVFAQNVPYGFNYQSIARDALGLPIVNTQVRLRISVIEGNIGGITVYQEQQTATTNQFGLVNLVIGKGTRVGGTLSLFSDLNWASNNYFVFVEVDKNNAWVSLGISQFQSVPYALAADNALKIQSQKVSPTTPSAGQFLRFNAVLGEWEPSNLAGANGGTVTSVTGISPIIISGNPNIDPQISIQQAGSGVDGYLSAPDWATFNNKLDASSLAGGDLSGTFGNLLVERIQGRLVSTAVPTNGQVLIWNNGLAIWEPGDVGTGTVTTVTSAGPISITNGGTTPDISISQASNVSDGYISVADYVAFNAKLSPSSAFAGDISGTFNAISVDQIKNTPVDLTGIVAGQVLSFDGSAFVPAFIPAATVAITSSTIGVTASGSNIEIGIASGSSFGLLSPIDFQSFNNKVATIVGLSGISINQVGNSYSISGANASQWATTTAGIIYNGGNVAIGTSANPLGARLIVVEDASNNPAVFLSGGGIGKSVNLQLGSTILAAGGIGIAGATGSFSGVALAGDMVVRSENNLILSTRGTANDIKFTTGIIDTEKMRITGSGDLGIGTTAPNEKLTVQGNSSVTGIGYFGTIIGNNLTGAAGSVVTVDGAGRLGIGTMLASTNYFTFSGNNIITRNLTDNIQLASTAGAFIIGATNIALKMDNTNSVFIGNTGNTTNGGSNNYLIGEDAGKNNASGSFNIFVGKSAGIDNASGNGNNFMGNGAGIDNVSGSQNIFVGSFSGGGNISGSNNIALGANINFQSLDISNAIAIGASTRIEGSNQIVMGSNITGLGINVNPTAMLDVNGGARIRSLSIAGSVLTVDGLGNVGLGSFISGSNNWTVQGGNLQSLSNEDINVTTATGAYRIDGLKVVSRIGINNIFLGETAGNTTLTGTNNFVVGSLAGISLGAGATHNIFMGKNTGKNSTSGGNNIFLGPSTGINNISGSRNVYLGSDAATNLNSNENIVIGADAGSVATSANGRNILVGYYSSRFMGGDQNIFLGSASGELAQGNTNIGIGSGAGSDADGNDNIYLGSGAGNGAVHSGDNNIMIGTDARLSGTNINNSAGFGSNVSITGSNRFVIGANITGLGINTNTPTAMLDVNGGARIRSLSIAGSVLTVDGLGNVGLGSLVNGNNQWLTQSANQIYTNSFVGIGTSNPNSQLTVFGNTSIVGNTNFSGGVLIADGTFNIGYFSLGTARTVAQMDNISVVTALGANGIAQNYADDWYYRAYYGQKFDRNGGQQTIGGGYSGNNQDNGSAAFRYWDLGLGAWRTDLLINAYGNVGIGTASPNQKLSVVGNISATGIGYFSTISGLDLNGAAAGSVLTVDGAGKLGFGTLAANSSSQWITSFPDKIYTNSFVGVGLINPTVPLEVTGDSKFNGNIAISGITQFGDRLNFQGDANQGIARSGAFGTNGVDGPVIHGFNGGGPAGGLGVKNGASEFVILNWFGSGVSIGNAEVPATSMLDVNGTIRFRSLNTNGAVITVDGSGNLGIGTLAANNTFISTALGTSFTSDKIAIGVATTGGAALKVNGDISGKGQVIASSTMMPTGTAAASFSLIYKQRIYIPLGTATINGSINAYKYLAGGTGTIQIRIGAITTNITASSDNPNALESIPNIDVSSLAGTYQTVEILGEANTLAEGVMVQSFLLTSNN
ncbi:MAG: beta strand repeat-containing protein [Cytophagales bacterium]